MAVNSFKFLQVEVSLKLQSNSLFISGSPKSH